LVAAGVDADRVVVVMNTVDERLLPDPSSRRAGQHARIVYHGTITPWYGVDLLVEAAAALSRADIGFVVELYGEGDGVSAIRQGIALHDLGDRVTLIPSYLPHSEVLARVSNASAGVIPNRPTELNQFALSSKLFEYIALGIPVVSADLPTIRGYFSDEEVRFFEPGNVDALADALFETISDPQASMQRAERARRRYEEYRWPIQAARYVSLLRAVAR